VLADVEQQVMALRELHERLRDLTAGENFGGGAALLPLLVMSPVPNRNSPGADSVGE